ncbi:unnamed protein product [Lupinus luteus]|uniref:Uncharacterized protein n=1 Tax=Lupinus luteus TaxID=3873 RepID=A0AAV1W7R4_LUPLU
MGESKKEGVYSAIIKESSTIGEIKGVLAGHGNFELFPINEGGPVLEKNGEKRGEVSNVGFVNKDVDPPFNGINALSGESEGNNSLINLIDGVTAVALDSLKDVGPGSLINSSNDVAPLTLEREVL